MSTHPFWSADGFARIADGRLVRPSASSNDAAITGISTDTRSITKRQAFFALKGDNFDGHDFLDKAVDAGASLLVVSNESAVPRGATALVVDDTLTALQRLAAAWRDVLREHGCKVIAITGSNGKTTTRHIVHSVLSHGEAAWPGAALTGTQSPKSFNNHIGVPLTLLAAKADHDFVVVEMGMNHAGEIAALTAIARPDVAAVTHLGRAHIGLLGSREAIAREKASIFDRLPPRGLAVMPARPHWPAATMPQPPCRIVRFTGDREHAITADLYIADRTTGANGVQTFQIATRDGATMPLSLPLPGAHNATNTLIAVAIARWMGMTDPAIAAAVAGLSGAPMRLEHTTVGTGSDRINIINDAYNANPDSMQAALAHLATAQPPSPTGRRIAILGDMFELGDRAQAEHRDLARAIDDAKGIDVAVFIGEMTMFTGDELRSRWDAARVHTLGPWADTTPGRAAAIVQPGDVVLLKASRGMALERIVPALTEKLAPRE